MSQKPETSLSCWHVCNTWPWDDLDVDVNTARVRRCHCRYGWPIPFQGMERLVAELLVRSTQRQNTLSCKVYVYRLSIKRLTKHCSTYDSRRPLVQYCYSTGHTAVTDYREKADSSPVTSVLHDRQTDCLTDWQVKSSQGRRSGETLGRWSSSAVKVTTQ